MEKHPLPVLNIYVYVLMPNHFHIAVKVIEPVNEYDIMTKLGVSRRLSNTFISYGQAYNRKYERRGGLFLRPFRRAEVGDDVYLLKLIHYIHYNPVSHNSVDRIDKWLFSSYIDIINREDSFVSVNEIIDLFEDIDNFIYCHKEEPSISGIE